MTLWFLKLSILLVFGTCTFFGLLFLFFIPFEVFPSLQNPSQLIFFNVPSLSTDGLSLHGLSEIAHLALGLLPPSMCWNRALIKGCVRILKLVCPNLNSLSYLHPRAISTLVVLILESPSTQVSLFKNYGVILNLSLFHISQPVAKSLKSTSEMSLNLHHLLYSHSYLNSNPPYFSLRLCKQPPNWSLCPQPLPLQGSVFSFCICLLHKLSCSWWFQWCLPHILVSSPGHFPGFRSTFCSAHRICRHPEE